MTATINRPAIGETNGLVNGLSYHRQFNATRCVDWTTKGLKVTRFRIVSDPGFPFWDVSYCHGTLNGEDVRVSLPFFQLPKKGLISFIITAAKKDKVYAKGLGILDNISSLC